MINNNYRYNELNYDIEFMIYTLEDIDCLFNTNRDSDNNDKELLNEVLQLLDGINSFPIPILFIATTNYLDSLDKALYRPGRFDLVQYVGNISYETASKMSKSFNVELEDVLKYNNIIMSDTDIINPSYLQEYIINYIGYISK